MPSPSSEKRLAVIAGLDRYFTGRPCKHGHLAERRVQNNGVCGLHVPWNLRVITAIENNAKGSRLGFW